MRSILRLAPSSRGVDWMAQGCFRVGQSQGAGGPAPFFGALHVKAVQLRYIDENPTGIPKNLEWADNNPKYKEAMMPANTLIIFFVITVFLTALIQIHIFEIAFAKLGLTPEITLLLLIGTLIGSGINLPLFSLRTRQAGHLVVSPGKKPFWEIYQPIREGRIVIAVNVGGCIIPVGMCLYFMSLQLIDPINILIALSAVTALCYKISRLIPGFGVGMPMLIAPLAAATLALILDHEHAAHLAYVSGVLGVLFGADILKLKEIVNLGAPIAAIGGAGTFDGIFLTGIMAALLA
ncbi:MAG: DUF1614 domain-containing protein [Gammaproteobacteria bacterium]